MIVENDTNARTWGMACHLASLSRFVIPFGSIIGPLIVWQAKKNEFAFVDDQGKEAVNFNLSWFIWEVLAAVSIVALVGFLVLPVLLIADLILVVVASIRANDGEAYRYPMTIRFFK
jgi:uncharacterized Tic20 family protein